MEDPGIKLFGKKIVLPETSKSIDRPLISIAGEGATGGDNHNKDGGSDHNHGLVKTCLEGNRVNGEDTEKDQLKPKHSEIKDESNNPKTPSIQENEKEKHENDPKTLKKPDKILPCPRCTSMDTKFCYFNNYNVNQPRHFCKSCQRYWTAGGAMRNMPVGAGRRKNKNPATHCRYITMPQETFRPDIPIPAICPPLPIYPSTYWNCIPFLPPLTSHLSDSILGKHSRDGFSINRNGCDEELKKMKSSSVLIPKTLRIDDPDEAAKSSIWATLGIKGENFKAFQEKGEETKKRPVTIASPALEANPAAFSRSLCFQESA